MINQVDMILDILRLKYLKAYISYEGVHRREKLEYPYEALREAIINALVHRYYTNTSNLQIRVYDDKLVLYNGATLNPEVPIEKFNQPHQSKPFNPTMASVFYKCGFIENWGKGTINIINECLEYGLPAPTFEYEWEAVRTTFYKRVENEIVDGGINGGINEILDFISKKSGLSAVQISQNLGVPLRTVQRQIKELKDKNYIEYKGSKKTGGYYAK
ncbi:ATP-binding protein [Aliarcobacter cryaerophilus]|uniref:ATP-binding protein n=1 Tax=Aliarcobacter cryaerophilus TaxID=28198 RepID=UPI002095FD28|nr:ATP-binding protein [Aliarcobacter cryaerophilus]